MMASQVAKLREEITAILNLCDVERGDRVIVQLNSGGGTVTGYGLGAAQLERLKKAGLHLTVTIDEVAASGGYLMACVADKIIASPFAVLGSIGVVATIPNFSERLQREGVVVEDVTAGKYKRTLTPYKKPRDEDRAKMKSDVENILVIFKSFVKQHRPQLDIENIATGETWHGPDALKLGLVDELATSDELLLQLRKQGADIYSVGLKASQPRFSDLMDGEDASGSVMEWFKVWAIDWFGSVLSSAIQNTIFNTDSSNSVFGNGGINDVTMFKEYHQMDQAIAQQQRLMAITDPNQYPRL